MATTDRSGVAELSLKRVLVFVTIFIVSFGVAYLFVERIQLPFSNPHGIVGTLSAVKYNPSTNILRFLFVVLLPSFSLIAAYLSMPALLAAQLFPTLTSNPKTDHVQSTRTLAGRLFYPSVVAVTLFTALNMESYMAAGAFETYEEGQPLSAGLSYVKGGVPYKDFVFFHGLYDEPLRAWLAFGAFGKSVAALRTMQSLTKIAAFCFMSAFLVLILGRNRIFALVTVFVFYALQPREGNIALNKAGISALHSIIVMPRDLALFMFLVTLALLARRIQKRDSTRGLFWIAAAFSAVPVLGFIHSMERGLYLITTFTVLAPALYIFFFRKGGGGTKFLTGCAVGLATSVTLLAFLIRGAFTELFRVTTFLASKDLQLQFGFVFPFQDVTNAIVCLVMAFNAFVVVAAFLRHWRAARRGAEAIRAFLEGHLIEVGLLLLSMLYFRNALGRSDWIHVGYCLPAPAILFLFIAFTQIVGPVLNRVATLQSAVNIGVLILCAVLSVHVARKVIYGDLLSQNIPLKYADDHYVPENWKQTIAFLQDNLAEDGHFFTLSGDIGIYYFVDRKCPVRFPLLDSVAKDERYQKEITDDLQTHKVKYVILDRKSIYYRIDGVGNDLRAPLVFDYIRRYYRPYSIIDETLIFARDRF